MRRVVVIVVLTLLMAGCASDDDTELAPEPTAVQTDGEPAGQALDGFGCRATEAGNWRASGRVRNDDDVPKTYQVTVVVSADIAGQGETTQLDNVQPGGSAPFEFSQLPATGENPTCRVRVASF